jgi:hypothetical protein
MPRVVPSQIVALIDDAFPQAKTDLRFPVYLGNAATVKALVDLCQMIPPELITISGADYSDYVRGVASLETALNRWIHRGGDDPPTEIRKMSPLVIIREALSKCPDASPAPSTSGLNFIPDPVLRESIRLDLSSANNAMSNGEWKAATVLAGSVVEAMLLRVVDGHVSLGNIKKPSGNPNEWGLSDLGRVALDLSLIKRATWNQVQLAKDFRNLIHPGRSQRLSEACDRGTALSALAAAELVARDLT